MHKIFFGIQFLLFSALILSCKSRASSTNLLDNPQAPPVIVLKDGADSDEKSMAALLSDSFLKTTGTSLVIQTETNLATTKGIKIHVGHTKHNLKSPNLSKIKNDGYCIECKDDIISLFGKNKQGTKHSVISFIRTYLDAFYVSPGEINYVKKTKIDIKTDEVIISNPTFEYREAFFPSAMHLDFTTWNRSHHLENEWILWGHNLSKFLKGQPLPPEAYALINGIRNKEQFCFSNKSLLNETKKAILQKLQNGFKGKRVAIWPNDNSMVCSCKDCKALGSSETNASPAVNQFISTLANEFKQLQFFASSYLTTQTPGTQKLPPNTGVFISTIDYPKNVPINKSKYKGDFEQRIKSWKNVTSTIYIWDYAVNYTLYSDFFPSLKGLQEDLKYFNSLGVGGVFVQGSDYDYSTFEDIKSFTISGLLWNPNLDLDSLRYSYIENAYPENVEFLNDYLVQTEKAVFQKNFPLSIYAGVFQSLSSYLEPAEFELFYYGLSEKIKGASAKEQERLKKAYTMLTHLKLEVMRSLGVNNYGYASISKDYVYEVQKEINLLQVTLDSLSKGTGLNILNEPKITIETYINQWKEYIENQAVKNIFYKGRYTVKSVIDDGYEKRASFILTDGALGFLDYETNWLLSTNKPLEIELGTASLKSSKELSFNFLSNFRHAIYTPLRIEIYELPTNKLMALYTKKTSDENVGIRKISLNIDLSKCQSLLVKMIPDNTQNPNKTAIACDELLFR